MKTILIIIMVLISNSLVFAFEDLEHPLTQVGSQYKPTGEPIIDQTRVLKGKDYLNDNILYAASKEREVIVEKPKVDVEKVKLQKEVDRLTAEVNVQKALEQNGSLFDDGKIEYK